MPRPAVAIAPAQPPPAPAPPHRRSSITAPAPALPLTRRASLNVVAFALDFGVKTAVGLVVTPLLVERLGAALFGVWEILGRLAGYVAALGGRPADALRLVVANRQAGDSSQRRATGSALVVWLLFLPLATAASAAFAWYAPTLTGAPDEWRTAVRVSAGVLFAGGLVGALLSVPESVLYGMNLGYKRMELQAGLNLAGGLLTAGAVYAGLGLMGVSGAQVILAALSGLCFWILAKRYVGWFGAARPSRAEVKTQLGLSAWLAGGDLIAKLLLASDVLILGILVSPTIVTTYVLTGYAGRAAAAIHTSAVGAAMPGLGGLIGDRQYERATLVRRELLALTWLFTTAVGVTILRHRRESAPRDHGNADRVHPRRLLYHRRGAAIVAARRDQRGGSGRDGRVGYCVHARVGAARPVLRRDRRPAHADRGVSVAGASLGRRSGGPGGATRGPPAPRERRAVRPRPAACRPRGTAHLARLGRRRRRHGCGRGGRGLRHWPLDRVAACGGAPDRRDRAQARTEAAPPVAMKPFRYRELPQLPRLAWLAVLNRDARDVLVYHGSALECRDDWMVEGTWDGEFAIGGFHDSEHFFGSGIRTVDDAVHFVPSSALVNGLFYCERRRPA
ncbi:MAG: hypothetical protein DMD67_03560 [Gemmatimonadetes bacterium]|nr:MAG: hypothetical protein DMD67_03560 [Gemmatimonadota bacterium]